MRNAAPRTLLAGPLPMVSTGYRRAWSRLISVPSFCAKNVTGRSPCAVSASRIAPATSRATPARAPLRIVAFSRSSRPIEPISWLSEVCTSPSSRLTTSAASSSCRAETGANTLVITTPSAWSPTRYWMVPITPVGRPPAPRSASTGSDVVVLPLVPVMPITVRRRDGCPW